VIKIHIEELDEALVQAAVSEFLERKLPQIPLAGNFSIPDPVVELSYHRRARGSARKGRKNELKLP
jgi:hypothetical protein